MVSPSASKIKNPMPLMDRGDDLSGTKDYAENQYDVMKELIAIRADCKNA